MPKPLLDLGQTARLARLARESPEKALGPIAAAALFLLFGDRPTGRKAPTPTGWRAQLQPYAASRAWERTAPAWAVPLVTRAARASGVPAQLLGALIRTESAWQPQVISSAGAIGLAQLMPATAQELGVDPWDPAQNVRGGARYLRQQLDRFNDVTLALAAYNAGPHRVQQYGGVPPFRETQAYVQKVLGRLVEA